MVAFTTPDGSGTYVEPVVNQKFVRSSNGAKSYRPVIEGRIEIGGTKFVTKFSLADRTLMSHNVLIGRDLLKAGDFLIDFSGL